ncbi:hypothetical protein [Caulobacter sp. 1776]|uniref:hypothetical protein n=1 Tax=Caulobacter sp. 1776 TaxID=3156420 RepID=UPI0033926945
MLRIVIIANPAFVEPALEVIAPLGRLARVGLRASNLAMKMRAARFSGQAQRTGAASTTTAGRFAPRTAPQTAATNTA